MTINVIENPLPFSKQFNPSKILHSFYTFKGKAYALWQGIGWELSIWQGSDSIWNVTSVIPTTSACICTYNKYEDY